MAEEARRHRISAVLIRGPGQPDGDVVATLEIEAPLDRNGALLDPGEGRTAGQVRRSWPDRPAWKGELVRLETGWGLRGTGEGDDSPVWELQGRPVRPGEYLTLVRPNDAESVFRVVNVEAC